MNETVLNRTVRTFPSVPTNDAVHAGAFFLNLVSTGSKMEPWGGDWMKRDRQLRKFWKDEPFLASAVYSIVATRASFNWEIDGPPRTVRRVHQMLQQSQFGKGFLELKKKVAVDLLTQDNGAFVEVIRSKPPRGQKPENMPVIGLAHLDAARCVRTGNPKTPVIYIDDVGKYHRLKWFQVITFEEMPSPEEVHHDRQVSFITRVLNAAQIVKEINTYQQEKVSGRFNRAIHLVGGVAQAEIDRLEQKSQLDADNAGLTHYIQPVILASLDPNARVSRETIELATLPDHFNFDELMKWYISLLAMAAGGDYQDLAPLPGGNLGTASQSETLHQKSRIKGHLLWMKLWEHKLQHHGILPPSVTFRYMPQDAAAEIELADVKHKRAVTRAARIQSREISLQVARQLAVDDGDLPPEYLMMMGETDETPNVVVPDSELPPSENIFDTAPGDASDQTWVDQPSPGAPGSVEAMEEQARLDQQQARQEARLQMQTRVPNNVGRGTSGGRPPKEEQRKAVGLRVASAAAVWLKQIVEDHPVQTVSPIPASKLMTFAQWLRNNITEETAFGTDENWQDRILTRAAYESGIHPHVLRMRLPDNYHLTISPDRVEDNLGNVIYQRPAAKEVVKKTPTVQVASGNACYVCGGFHHRYSYMPAQGWLSTCKDHANRGLHGNATPEQYNFPALLAQFNKQFTDHFEKAEYNKLQALVLSALLYAFELGSERKSAQFTEKEVQGIREVYEKQAALLEVSQNPALFTLALNTAYYSGVRASWKGRG